MRPDYGRTVQARLGQVINRNIKGIPGPVSGDAGNDNVVVPRIR